jgi:type IV pilus assembly protein PilW
MNKHTQFRAGHIQGFSLVELMVAMTLSLVLLAGAIGILYSSRVTYSENERIARIQEAGRTTVEILMRDIRAAGYNGCARRDPAKYNNVLNTPTTLLWNFGRPIEGYEATGASAWTPALDALIVSPTSDSDVLVLRTTREGLPIFRTNAPTTVLTDPIKVDVDGGATVANGTTMVVGDCEYSTVFQVTGFTPGVGPAAGTATIDHVAAAGAPGNADAGVVSNFRLNSLVAPIDTIIYYVRQNTTNTGPALWQIIGANPAQQLIDGVENIQVRYGVDAVGNDMLVDQYDTADAVQAANNWSKVVSVEIAALVRSVTGEGVGTDTRTYDLLGTALGPYNDRNQRIAYTTTIALRNGAK